MLFDIGIDEVTSEKQQSEDVLCYVHACISYICHNLISNMIMNMYVEYNVFNQLPQVQVCVCKIQISVKNCLKRESRQRGHDKQPKSAINLSYKIKAVPNQQKFMISSYPCFNYLFPL